jgi:protein-tyrosine phosphatase
VRRIAFVDCHSHVVPSGDDGAQSLDEGSTLCREAALHGTAILYATPHVSPYVPLTREREEEVREAFARLRAEAPLELRLGYELTPTAELLDEDPVRFRLEETELVLVEVPFVGPTDLVFTLGDQIAEAELTPLIGHPERTEAVLADPRLVDAFGERGWPLQVNTTSLLGRHGPEREALAWWLVESGRAAAVASDGHRTTRPARLDDGYELVRARVGERAVGLFDGSALGLGSASPRPGSSRAATRGA